MEPFIGEIRMIAGFLAPNGWALCNGQLLNIDHAEALFQLIGTTYGGDGMTTFALPDFRDRIPMHSGVVWLTGSSGTLMLGRRAEDIDPTLANPEAGFLAVNFIIALKGVFPKQ